MVALMPPKPRKHSRFCGIDIGKNKHVACLIDREGAALVRSQSFTNDTAGYQRILDCLQEVGGPSKVAVAMEATGHYWYSLHDFLVRQRYDLAVLNPIQTARQVTKGIRKTQTDRIDAHHIAVLLKNGEHRPALIPGERGLTCRQLTRLHHAMVRQESRIKQLIWSRLHPVWPEYEPLFATPFCKTGRSLLNIAPTCREAPRPSHSEAPGTQPPEAEVASHFFRPKCPEYKGVGHWGEKMFGLGTGGSGAPLGGWFGGAF